MQSTLNQMHEDRFAEDEQQDRAPFNGVPAASREGSAADRARSSSGDPMESSEAPEPRGDAEWIEHARSEATRRRTPQEFIDKKATSAAKRIAAQPGGEATDEALFLRYQAGDDAAFVAIYERYKT